MKRSIYLFLCTFALFLSCAQGQDLYGNPDAPVAARVYNTLIRTTNGEEMGYIIKQKLIERYVQQKEIVVTDDEIETYITKKRAFQQHDIEQREVRRKEIMAELSRDSMSKDERGKLESELRTLNELHEMDLENESQENADPKVREAEEQIAEAFIKQWKINRALYQEYGGRVIYQQGGAEPLDAYRIFLENAQKKGEFEILNKEFETDLWNYYTTDSKHSFYPDNEKEKAINTPWWLNEDTTP